MMALSRWPRLAAFVSLVLVVPAAGICAETPVVGDASRGAALSATCQACHGAQGEGNPAGGFPRLAGQTADYLAAQLRNFADGRRASAVMGLMCPVPGKQNAPILAIFHVHLRDEMRPASDYAA